MDSIQEALKQLEAEFEIARREQEMVDVRVQRLRVAVDALRGVLAPVGDEEASVRTVDPIVAPAARRTKDAILDVLGAEPMRTGEILDEIERRGWLDPKVERPINAVSSALIRLARDQSTIVEKVGRGYRRRDVFPAEVNALLEGSA